MHFPVKPAFLLLLLIATAPSAWSADGRVRSVEGDVRVNGQAVTVEAMIGEATLTEEVDGEKDTIVVSTGQTTKKDPTTGKLLLTPSTTPNRVNAVVHAIVAAAPDASNGISTDEGCSENRRPLRADARPVYDPETAAAIDAQLAVLSKSELMMVMAVLINNARHLCIDSTAIVAAVGIIASARPEEAGDVVFVAALLDPENTDNFVDAAEAAAPNQVDSIQQAKDTAEEVEQVFGEGAPTGPPGSDPKPPVEIPPGGGAPSPE